MPSSAGTGPRPGAAGSPHRSPSDRGARDRSPKTATALRLSGMGCGRCEKAAKARFGALDGVVKVAARALTGEITLTSRRPLDEQLLRSTADRLGFTVTAVTTTPTGTQVAR